MQQFPALFFNIASDEQGIHRMRNLFGQFFCLSDQFISHRVYLAVHMVNIHYDSVP